MDVDAADISVEVMYLEKFFDRVNHDVQMAREARKVQDKRMPDLIRRYLQSGVLVGGLMEARSEGTPQGGPLSPLLSNILLDDLDKELEARGHAFCRYADDCNIYVRSWRGRNLGKFIREDLNPLLRGWANYFVLSEVKGVFEELDGWIRRKPGLADGRARESAWNGRGPWWNSWASHLNAAFPAGYYQRLGLVSLLTQVQWFWKPTRL